MLDSRAQGSIRDMIAGSQWVIRQKEKYGIRVVNISIGSFVQKGMREDSELVQAVDAMWDAGLTVCVAAGNRGSRPMTITTPGISRKVITVGCCDDTEEVEVLGSQMVDYSGRGPTRACIIKPELVARGFQMQSCNVISEQSPLPYCAKSGTSMATPQISGAVALLLSKFPEMTNVQVKKLLLDSCRDLGLPPAYQGWGILDLERFLRGNR